MDYHEIAKDMFSLMIKGESNIKKSFEDIDLLNLVKIRASQINHCSFCLDMHTEEALKRGESAQRIFALKTWQQSDLFTEKERAALHLVESLTLLSFDTPKEDLLDELKKHFSDKDIVYLVYATTYINSWNRLNIFLRKD